MAQDPYEIIEEIQHCIHCGRDIHDCAPAQKSCEDCIIEGRDMAFSKSYEEISEIAAGYDPNSDDLVIAETAFILNTIIGKGPDAPMTPNRAIIFLEDCADGRNTVNKAINDALAKASANVYLILFGN